MLVRNCQGGHWYHYSKVNTLKYPPWYRVSGGPNMATSHSLRLSSISFTRKPSTGSSCRLLYSCARALWALVVKFWLLAINVFFAHYVYLCIYSTDWQSPRFTASKKKKMYHNIIQKISIMDVRNSNDCEHTAHYYLNITLGYKFANERITFRRIRPVV